MYIEYSLRLPLLPLSLVFNSVFLLLLLRPSVCNRLPRRMWPPHLNFHYNSICEIQMFSFLFICFNSCKHPTNSAMRHISKADHLTYTQIPFTFFFYLCKTFPFKQALYYNGISGETCQLPVPSAEGAFIIWFINMGTSLAKLQIKQQRTENSQGLFFVKHSIIINMQA